MIDAKDSDVLQSAWRIQDDAAQLGFDWPSIDGVLDKIQEELEEVREALAAQDNAHAQLELGDLLFSIINAARFLKVDPAEMLHATNEKFIQRFSWVQSHFRQQGRAIENCSLDELEAAWQCAKTVSGSTEHKISSCDQKRPTESHCGTLSQDFDAKSGV